jgi:tRNA (guanine37-N1)-methyltransferase
MRIQVLTIFPELFGPFLATSLVGRAIARGLLAVEVRDLRDFAADRHRSVDDEPYGGGGGMVMMAPPWIRAVRALTAAGDEAAAGAPGPAGAAEPVGPGGSAGPVGPAGSAGLVGPAGSAGPVGAAERRPWRVLLSPQGVRLDDAKVRELAARGSLILLSGRYEGIDERVRQTVVDEEISIGDYVLSGGELPAMVLIEAVSRQVPGVVGQAESVAQDSFREGLLDHPHYTRPPVVEGLAVPPVLLSGDHAAIRRWRREQAESATRDKRPDLQAALARSRGVGQ